MNGRRGCEQRAIDICAAVEGEKICVKFDTEEYAQSGEKKASERSPSSFGE